MAPVLDIFPPRTSPTQAQIEKNLDSVLKLQHGYMIEHGKQPFAASLVGPDHQTILLTHGNAGVVNHAEACLARLAAVHFSPAYLWTCTLYTTWEPCAMCSGTAYWANIGRIVFGASNEQLLELTGMGNPLNMTLNGSCRGVLGEGQKDVEVIGPVERLDSKIMEDSDWFWRKNRSDGD